MPEYSEAEIEKMKNDAKAAGVAEFLKVLKVPRDKLVKTAELAQAHDIEAVIKERDSLKLDNEVINATSRVGFRDTNYAKFLYTQHIGSLNDDQRKDVNAEKFLESIKNDKQYSAFFTGSTGDLGNRKAPDTIGNSGGSGGVDLSDASPSDLTDYFSKLGL